MSDLKVHVGAWCYWGLKKYQFDILRGCDWPSIDKMVVREIFLRTHESAGSVYKKINIRRKPRGIARIGRKEPLQSLTADLLVSLMIVRCDWSAIWKVKNLYKWIPHEFNETPKLWDVEVCSALLAWNINWNFGALYPHLVMRNGYCLAVTNYL